MVNVNKSFHSTFSARILSASLSAISAGLSPVIISTSGFLHGRVHQLGARDDGRGRAGADICQRPNGDGCLRRFADAHERWVARFADALDDAQHGGQFCADGLPALFDDAVNGHASRFDFDLPSQPKHWPPEDSSGLRGGQPCAIVESLATEDDHVCAADLVDGSRQHARRADGIEFGQARGLRRGQPHPRPWQARA